MSFIRISTQTSTQLLCLRSICTSNSLSHNPGLKKKSKVLLDQKKLQKQKLKQELRQRKQVIQPPVDPDSIPDPSWFNLDRQRVTSSLTEEQLETNALLEKEWSRYQMKKHIEDMKRIRDKLKYRANALKELRKESEFLYQEALHVDKDMLPLVLKGPMETPPITGYEAPDFVDGVK